MIPEEVGPEESDVLERFGFDRIPFAELRNRVTSGALSLASNVVSGVVEPPLDDDITALPDRGSRAHEAAREVGTAALAAGQIGAVVLAGGMATRFGGVVKGILEVFDGRSFLELKLEDAARAGRSAGGELPVALMTSFATDEHTRAHVAALDVPAPLWFSQFVSLRLTPEGELFRDERGSVSLYGPGHGDLLEAIRSSGTLATLRSRGVEHVVVSNVDNLAARIDPAVIGMHLLGGRSLTSEVAPRGGDLGGAPVRVDGRLQMLEAPRFPPSFDQARIPIFNTNTTTIALTALESPVELTWLYVEKDAAGRTAVQLERVYHELAAHIPTTVLEVPRGPHGRFAPIKVPADLDALRDELRAAFAVDVFGP